MRGCPETPGRRGGQHGILCTRDATRLDVDANGLAALVDAGVLMRLRRGAYVVTGPWAAPRPSGASTFEPVPCCGLEEPPWRRPPTRAPWRCTACRCYGAPADVVDIFGRVKRVGRAAGLRVHPADDSLVTQDVDGCRVCPSTSPWLRWPCGRDATPPWSLPTEHWPRRWPTSTVSSRWSPPRGVTRQAARAERWLRQADSASESVGETRTRLLLADLGHNVGARS